MLFFFDYQGYGFLDTLMLEYADVRYSSTFIAKGHSPVVRQLADRELLIDYMWFVYALYDPTVKKIYIGETSDLNRRLVEHNEKRGNHFTAKFNGEWVLIYQEAVLNRKEALRREKQLKSFQGRTFIKKQIMRI